MALVFFFYIWEHRKVIVEVFEVRDVIFPSSVLFLLKRTYHLLSNARRFIILLVFHFQYNKYITKIIPVGIEISLTIILWIMFLYIRKSSGIPLLPLNVGIYSRIVSSNFVTHDYWHLSLYCILTFSLSFFLPLYSTTFYNLKIAYFFAVEVQD